MSSCRDMRGRWYYPKHCLKCSRLLLVLSLAPRGFSPGTPDFPSPQKPTLPNSNSIWNVRTRLNEFIWTPKCFVGKKVIYNFFYVLSNQRCSPFKTSRTLLLLTCTNKNEIDCPVTTTKEYHYYLLHGKSFPESCWMDWSNIWNKGSCPKTIEAFKLTGV